MSEDLKTKEACEQAGGTWNEANNTCTMPHNELKTDADLMRENEMLKARVDLREKQLKQAIDIANRANAKRQAEEEAEKQSLIQSIQMDGKFDKDELEKKSLEELKTMRFTLDRSIEKTFANVAADINEQQRKRKPLLTVGYYDSAAKTWKEGIE